ncbi:MAG: glycosyltransferase family 9 protein [Alphaproteobacteria bacterium]|nr:glycosyltransferase family 9 protein [Alphaproteobacteria bacterium]
MSGRKILVIKHGAFGDIVLATGPFAAIRAAHSGDRITLLTSSAFVEFLESSPYFDSILVDDRPRLFSITAWRSLVRTLRAERFDRVYDLQTSSRSLVLFHLLRFSRSIEWSGTAHGCSHPHGNPRRDFMHTIERQAEQLAAAGIARTPPPDLSWVGSDIARFALSTSYALLVPGGAPHRPAKRWPQAAFSVLASRLRDRAIQPVLLGTKSESATLAAIAKDTGALNLCGQTRFADIVGLARAARFAIGNDTGPLHAIAVAGCPALVLFSAASDPTITAPRGQAIRIVQKAELSAVTSTEVLAAIEDWIDR